MGTAPTDLEGLTLEGLERVVVFNRLRAAIGLRWELPRLLQRLASSSAPLV